MAFSPKPFFPIFSSQRNDIASRCGSQAIVARFAASRKRTRTPFLVGVRRHADAAGCLAAGCTDSLTKPIDLDQLAAVVCKLLDQPHSASCPGDECQSAPNACDIEERDEFAQLAREYAASLSEVASRARQAAAERDLASLAAIGHNLKGSGGTFGFAELTEIGGRMEMLGARQEFAQVAKVLDELSDVVERLTPDAGVH